MEDKLEVKLVSDTKKEVRIFMSWEEYKAQLKWYEEVENKRKWI